MMGKAHSPFWASHLQLRPEQDSALLRGPCQARLTAQDPQAF